MIKLSGRDTDTLSDPLTELLRRGAERLIYQAVDAELQELLAEHAGRRTEHGRAGVVRNAHLLARPLQTGVGPVTVRIPKVRAKTSEPVTFLSALVPPYVRKRRCPGCDLRGYLPQLLGPGFLARCLPLNLNLLP